MNLQAVIKLSSNLEQIRKQLELLEFWLKWPEISLIEVTHSSEYNDEGGYSDCHYIENIEFDSVEAQRALAIRCFYNKYTEEEKASYLNTGEDKEGYFREIDPSDWDDAIEFTSLRCLDNEDATYISPTEIENSIKEVETEADKVLIEYLKGNGN